MKRALRLAGMVFILAFRAPRVATRGPRKGVTRRRLACRPWSTTSTSCGRPFQISRPLPHTPLRPRALPWNRRSREQGPLVVSVYKALQLGERVSQQRRISVGFPESVVAAAIRTSPRSAVSGYRTRRRSTVLLTPRPLPPLPITKSRSSSAYRCSGPLCSSVQTYFLTHNLCRPSGPRKSPVANPESRRRSTLPGSSPARITRVTDSRNVFPWVGPELVLTNRHVARSFSDIEDARGGPAKLLHGVWREPMHRPSTLRDFSQMFLESEDLVPSPGRRSHRTRISAPRRAQAARRRRRRTRQMPTASVQSIDDQGNSLPPPLPLATDKTSLAMPAA